MICRAAQLLRTVHKGLPSQLKEKTSGWRRVGEKRERVPGTFQKLKGDQMARENKTEGYGRAAGRAGRGEASMDPIP